MKTKFLLLVVALLATLSVAKAQNNTQQTSRVKYQGEVQSGFGFGISGLSLDRVYLHTIQGMRIGKHFSTGIGIGLNLVPGYEFTYEKPELYMPLYANFKGYLSISPKSSLFASFDIGGSFGLTEGVSGLGGLYISPAIGVSIHNRVNLSVGYDHQQLTSGAALNSGALAVKLAVRF